MSCTVVLYIEMRDGFGDPRHPIFLVPPGELLRDFLQWLPAPDGKDPSVHVDFTKVLKTGWWFQTFGLFSISYMGWHPSH